MIEYNQLPKVGDFFQKDICSLTWQEIKFWDIAANKYGYEKSIENIEKIKTIFYLAI